MIKKHSFLPRLIDIFILNWCSFCLIAQRTAIGNLLIEGVGEIPTTVSERLEQFNQASEVYVHDLKAKQTER